MNKALALNAIILLGAIIAACVAHSVPTAPVTSLVAVPVANDPSANPTDEAADKNTTAIASDFATAEAAVVSSRPFVVLPDPRGPDVAPPFVVLPDPSKQPEIAEQMLADDSAIRVKSSRQPRTLNDRLCKAAQDHAEYMARYHQPRPDRMFYNPTYSHYSNGGPPARAARYGFLGPVQENIDLCLPGDPIDSWPAWCNSASHYSAILSDYPLAGFGLAYAKDGSSYRVALYGRESSQVAAAAPPAPVYSVPVRTAPQNPRRQISQQPYLILPPVDRHPPPLLHSTQTYSSCGPQGCPRIFRRGR